MRRLITALVELAVLAGIVGAGVWLLLSHPIGKDEAEATLAGALFGGAAVLLGNVINRIYERNKRTTDEEERRKKLKALIAAELVNLMNELTFTKELMDAAIKTINAGGMPPGQVHLVDYIPSGIPLTERLGVEMLLLSEPAIDALTTLSRGIAQTGKAMKQDAPLAGAIGGLSLLIARRLSDNLGQDLTNLRDAFLHVAPQRKVLLPGQDVPVPVVEYLANAALPAAN